MIAPILLLRQKESQTKALSPEQRSSLEVESVDGPGLEEHVVDSLHTGTTNTVVMILHH